MGQILLSIEVLSFAVVAIILYACIFETKHKNKKNNVFIALLILCMTTIGTDAVTWIIEGNTNLEWLYYISIVISFITAYASATVVALYVGYHVSENYKVPFMVYKVFTIIGIIATVVTGVACITGHVFTIQDCYYYPAEYYNWYIYSQLVYLACLLLTLIVFSKKIGIHDTIAFSLYIIMPTLIGAFAMNSIGYEVIYAAMGLDMLFIYIAIQSEKERGLIEQKDLSYTQARVDELTGLKNRLSFYEYLSQSSNTTVGVLFCDLNGLKLTNDKLGHAAGDELLRRFAYYLLGSFKKTETFRISGDEFVVCIQDITEDVFNDRVSHFQSLLSTLDRPIASFGKAYGNWKESDILIKKAKIDMYNDKNAFYEKYPEYKR